MRYLKKCCDNEINVRNEKQKQTKSIKFSVWTKNKKQNLLDHAARIWRWKHTCVFVYNAARLSGSTLNKDGLDLVVHANIVTLTRHRTKFFNQRPTVTQQE